jgi:hypothetical protein
LAEGGLAGGGSAEGGLEMGVDGALPAKSRGFWSMTCHARKATAATASAVETPKSQALDRPCISIIAKPCALED